MGQFVPAASALSLALLFSSAAFAQQPANAPAGGTPEITAFDIPYGVSISGEKAKQVLVAAEAEAKRRNWKEVIAVVDTNGDLVSFQRMDGAQIGSGTVSQGKARQWRRATGGRPKCGTTCTKPAIPIRDPRSESVASPGGFPLIEGGKLIGAIGCSGGTGDQDALICKIGADTIK